MGGSCRRQRVPVSKGGNAFRAPAGTGRLAVGLCRREHYDVSRFLSMASPKDSSSDRRKGLYSSKSCLSVPASAVRAPLTRLFVPADDPWPTLPHAGAARVPGLSTAQNEACALAHESHVRASGMTLRLARLLIGMLGIPSRCERPCCNRAAACTGERRGREWCFYPGPAWPPCVHSAGRVDILRPTVERLDALVEARLTAGSPGRRWTISASPTCRRRKYTPRFLPCSRKGKRARKAIPWKEARERRGLRRVARLRKRNVRKGDRLRSGEADHRSRERSEPA